MTHKAGIRLTDKRSGDISKHVVEFSEEEWSQLHSYLEHVRDLEATRFAREGGGVSLNLQWKEGSGLSWSVTMPPTDDLSALLHRLRPLILQSEPASFVKVRKLLERKLKDAPIGPLMRFLLDLYSGKELQKLIVMQSNDQIVNSEEMLFTWLNAHEYHRDRDKQELLDTLHTMLPLEWSKGVFLSLLVDQIKAILSLSVLVELAVGNRKTFSVSL